MRSVWRAVMPVVCVVSAASQATAQTGPDIADLTLEQLLNARVVTVTRTNEGATDAPGVVRVVTAAEIQRRGYRSLADLLRDLPGIKIDFAVDQDLSGDLTIQGTRGATRMVILLDGVRITSPTNEPLPILANYPIHSAQQVEIVYGPASALYGADAFSGVINIISSDPQEAGGVSATTSVGQDGLSNTTGSYGTTLGPARVIVAGQLFHDGQSDLSRAYPELFGNLESHRTGTFNTIFGPMVAGVPVSAEYHVPVDAHNVYALVEGGPWRASLFESRVRTSNTPAYTPDNAVYNDTAFAENSLLVGSVSYSAQVGRTDMTTTVTATRHELEPTSGYLNVFSGMQRSYKYAYGSTMRAEHHATWRAGGALRFTAGGTFERLFSVPQSADLNAPVTNRRRPGTLLGTDIEDEEVQLRYSNLGGYVQGQWRLHARSTLTAGIRGDYNSRYEAVFNPRIGIVTRLTDSTVTKVLYGTAYLAPSPYQAYLHYGSFYSLDNGQTYQSDYWHVPNPDLKPQHKRTLEGQVQQALGPNLNITASAFYSRFTDLVLESDITMRQSGLYRGWPVAFIQQSINGGRETTHGGTVSADYLLRPSRNRQLRVRGSLSLADGSVDDDSAPGGTIESGGFAPVLFQASADLDWDEWSFAPRLITAGRQRALALEGPEAGPLTRRTIAGYTTVDLSVRRARVAGPVGLFMTVDNLFDARYRHLNLRAFSNPEEFEGSPQNPRRITIGAQVSFGGRTP
jgi:outer membrane receptor for ferrienterochelin and colicin